MEINKTLNIGMLNFLKEDNKLTIVIGQGEHSVSTFVYYNHIYRSIVVDRIINSVLVDYLDIERILLNRIADGLYTFGEFRYPGKCYMGVRYEGNWYQTPFTGHSIAMQLIQGKAITFTLIEEDE